MDRRHFLGLASLGAASAEAVAQEIATRIESAAPDRTLRFVRKKTGGHPYTYREPPRRPHIFLISVDMVSPDHHHVSRDLRRHLDLPAIRSLMRDGVTFNNAFCASPLCAPARAALATGRYTYITANGERAHDGHETILRPDDVIFQEYLKATGYVTKHCGKGHLGTEKFMHAFDENDNAWDRWAPPIYDDELYLTHLRNMNVRMPRYRREIRSLQQDRKSPAHSYGGWFEQDDGTDFPLEAQYSHYLAARAIDKLDAALMHRPAAPVYLQLDFFDPHQPFSIPAGFEKRERELRASLPLPASYEAARARDWARHPDEPKIYDFYRRHWGLYDPQTVRDYRVANALQMEVVDGAIGRFVKALKQRGIYDEALIVFTADHGEMNGRRALLDKGVYLCPEVLRAPLAVKLPASQDAKPQTIDAPVSHLDIAPTLLEIAGIAPAARMDGQSLLPLLEGTASGGDRELLFECGWHVGVNFACATQHWSRSRHFLYTYNLSSTVQELYDLNVVEGDNLAANPEHTADRKEMVQRMAAILERDPRWLGYWHSFQVDHYFDLGRNTGDMQMFRPL